ncbi:MAG: RIO1 family regulatory kinase/ATPase, partial [Candidatus Macondimonas sp.]
MKIPKDLQPLIDDGIVDNVIRPLKSGKEASVYLVACGADVRCAKVYKSVEQRGFHKLAEYQEGRKTRNSRDQRALGKRSKHGREVEQAAWKNAEVDALYRLDAAGVRVPKPHGYFDGVLLMELVVGADGNAAPRLNDVAPAAEVARAWHRELIAQIVRMLCEGLIHGDLSEFNVLVGVDGLVI